MGTSRDFRPLTLTWQTWAVLALVLTLVLATGVYILEW